MMYRCIESQDGSMGKLTWILIHLNINLTKHIFCTTKCEITYKAPVTRPNFFIMIICTKIIIIIQIIFSSSKFSKYLNKNDLIGHIFCMTKCDDHLPSFFVLLIIYTKIKDICPDTLINRGCRYHYCYTRCSRTHSYSHHPNPSAHTPPSPHTGLSPTPLLVSS